MKNSLRPEFLPFNHACIAGSFRMRHPDPADRPAPEAVWAIMSGNAVVVTDGPDGPALPCGPLPPQLESRRTPLCIGLWHGTPLWTFSIGADRQIPAPYRAEPFNASEERLTPETLTLAGLARQILHWERQSSHCSRCGGATTRIPGSWGKRCASCSAEHFPHIHPCAIVLVRRDNELLLTRKKEWAPGRYSLVAGFLDFGESLEECAVREVKEETGIDIRNVRYVGSQNWPFPAQLMAGFVADYAGGEIAVDLHELEDARWFPVDALPGLPAKRSIARWIIDTCGQ